jgi:hypothetical protein
MARYKLREAAMIGDKRYEAGEEIEFDGVPGPHMEPVDPEAKKAVGAKPAEPERDPGMLAHREERTVPGRPEPKEHEPPRGGSRG